MRKEARSFVLWVAIGLILMAALVNSMQVRQAIAGPAPAPTPISAPAGGDDWAMVTYLSTNTVDVDVHSGGQQTAAYTVMDYSHTIDVGSAQTVTCYLDWSNDNTNWDRGLTVINAKTADETDMQQYNVFGRYSRITCTLGTSAEVTLTIKGKLSK